MMARTTIAIDREMLETLKRTAKEEDYHSLSSFIKDILLIHLRKYQEKKLFAQMKKDYEQYAGGMTKENWNTFKVMEEMALKDLNKRDPWK